MSGEAAVRVLDRLPITGIYVLLGNNLTDSCCHEKCATSLQISSVPVTTSKNQNQVIACILSV